MCRFIVWVDHTVLDVKCIGCLQLHSLLEIGLKWQPHIVWHMSLQLSSVQLVKIVPKYVLTNTKALPHVLLRPLPPCVAIRPHLWATK